MVTSIFLRKSLCVSFSCLGLLFVQHSAIAADTDADLVEDALDVDDDGDGLIEISTLGEFNNIRNNLSGTAYNDGSGDNSMGCGNGDGITACFGYELINDIDFDENGNGDLSDDSYWNSGLGFPMFSDSNFTGTLDGNEFHIKNLYLTSTTDRLGLFRTAEGATFQNLNFENVQLSGKSSVGVLAGVNSGSIARNNFYNINIEADITGDNNVGCLIGDSDWVDVNNVHCKADITSSFSNIGGLLGGTVGSGQGTSNIFNSSFVGSISGQHRIGGIVSKANYDIEIQDTYAVVDIDATGDEIGGIIGDFSDNYITVKRVIVFGDIEGDQYIGGIAGEVDAFELGLFEDIVAGANVKSLNSSGYARIGAFIGDTYDTFTINNVIAYGNVSSDYTMIDNYFGGLIGYSSSSDVFTSNNVYWDSESTGQATSEGGIGEPITTIQAQCPIIPGDNSCTKLIYDNFSLDNWDFGSSSQYPTLKINEEIYRDNDDDGYWVFEDAFDDDASEHLDTDFDGVGDNADSDDDGDGTPDVEDSYPLDTDNDGEDNTIDTDDDGDGFPDSEELLAGTSTVDANDYPVDASEGSSSIDKTVILSFMMLLLLRFNVLSLVNRK